MWIDRRTSAASVSCGPLSRTPWRSLAASPHLFITITATPNWWMLPTNEPTNRADLVTRVFMLDEIFKDGKCPACVWTIEYQKPPAGTAHLHLLVRTRTTFSNPRLSTRWCVRSSDHDRELAACMDDGECTKKYPRAFVMKPRWGRMAIRGTTPL